MFKIISFSLCPFVQRSIITLNYKNVPYEIEYIDLENRPDWFLKISPTGKVPVLLTEEGILFESAVINEYIDEVTEGQLLSSHPFFKAKQRAYIEYAGISLSNYFQAVIAKENSTYEHFKLALATNLNFLLAEFKGPFFTGDDFSLVDTSFIPLIQRIKVSGKLLEELDLSTEILDKFNTWANNTLELDEVRKSVLPTFNHDYDLYLKKSESYIYLK